MGEWHHQSNEHELGQTSGDSEGQGGLACCSPWGHKELDMTGPLNNNNIVFLLTFHIVLFDSMTRHSQQLKSGELFMYWKDDNLQK